MLNKIYTKIKVKGRLCRKPQKHQMLRFIWSVCPENRMTYNVLENVDLIEEHSLLIVVHVALAEHLDSTLGARLSVHAHSHLAEGA